uniref:1-phosphatidylinositol-3-phosphate 5-kinase n=1 Tax=Ziziphus jujuba TaxID=326968 RepID=A0A6P6GA43_ZIZJJ
MCSMCHHCEDNLTKSKDDGKIQKDVSSLKLVNQDLIGSCKFCGVKKEQESIKQGIMSPYATPMISPTTSLSSSDSTVSSYSDFSVDINSCDRYNQEEGTTYSSQEDLNYRSNGPLQNGVDKSHTEMQKNMKEDHNGSSSYIVRDIEITQTSNGQEDKVNSDETCHGSYNEETENPSSFEDERDALWKPPEPEDPEDDLEGSVAFNDDDDDECGDGTQWGKPSSLTPVRDEGSRSYRFKEERQRAIEEVINGKFKTIVCQLLKSVGISSSGEDGQTWVDVVTSLSWEAASFLKPDAVGCKAVDPDGYVKVKCIATGVRSQSQVVKGLVFKKHAAHKHMATKYKNPRLLLVQGVLGQSSSGLSSFDSMEQEKDYLKSVIEMLELCHPNVILVEKTVSRDIQESILSKGMTLVFDMKLHRLERIARCTGSPILTSDTLMSQKLKQCNSFYIEKFVEEHAGFGEGGKIPSKTLMFLEGFPTRLGCTILLKGASSDELKRIKCVVQCAVVMAYHLMLETSFLVDQRAMFSTIPYAGPANVLSTEVVNVLTNDQQLPELGSNNSCVPCLEEAPVETVSHTVDTPISNGFHDGGSLNSPSYEPYNPAILTGFSSLSDSLKKVIGENFPLASSSYQSLSTYFGFNGRESNGQTAKSLCGSTSPNTVNHYTVEDKDFSDEEKSGVQSHLCCETSLDSKKDGANDENTMQSEDGTNGVLDSKSILVLMSRRNALRGTICEQNHFSHIMFYKNFDVPLGKFLRDNLLNQRSPCSICGELPEAHFYYYAHHNKQLTIQIRRLSDEKHLPGEAEGKLWMWSRCGKCKHGNGMSKSTKRVLISTAARGLSFGKFLELGFSSSSKLSSCGHSLHWDFLYFFGLGPMAAMFRYSPVTTYTVSVPAQKIPFSNSIRQDWLTKETKDVFMKGMLLFTEVENSLKKVKSQFEGLTLNIGGSLKIFSDIEGMLQQERSDFELNIKKAISKNGNSDQAVYNCLSFNRLWWDLLLESCIWDLRIHSLLSVDPEMVYSSATDGAIQEQTESKINGSACENERNMGKGDMGINGDANLQELNTSLENGSPMKEIPIGVTDEESEGADTSIVVEGIEAPTEGGSNPKVPFSQEPDFMPNGSSHCHSDDSQADNVPLSVHLQVDRTIPISTNVENCITVANVNLSRKHTMQNPHLSNLEYSKGWFWAPFSEITEIDPKVLQKTCLPKFECRSAYTTEYLPTAAQLINEEGQRLHLPLGTNAYIVSDYEGELSSIIACALTKLKDLPFQADFCNDDSKGMGNIANKTIESLNSFARNNSFARIPTFSSSNWSSTSSLDSDSVHSTSGISMEELRSSSFDGTGLSDSLVTPGTLHPAPSFGFLKSLGKDRYTVLCPYAKQFQDLRSCCCQSELDYIASLSRCRNWDAKGGKSRSFFAKTLDDRLIIKEIKKTEFESFMKFAEYYFKYMKEAFELGNQTCLAKVLGIYQVIVRHTKGGKESRHDLMVMENLTFGRNITRQYDLKGALHARYNSATDGSGSVLLDQNFVDDMNSSPIYVSNKAKRVLERAVWNDTGFLTSINVMDYSLLVGVDTQKRELVCGIIDFLRQYTWDKQLETWVKSSLVPKNVLPTVISPIEYKCRFRKFMRAHFLNVPDHWCSKTTSEQCHQCQLCGVKDDTSTPSNLQEKEGLNGFST